MNRHLLITVTIIRGHMATIVTICLTLMKRIHFCPNGLFNTIFAHKAGATEISAKLAIATCTYAYIVQLYR
jgi:hypothetical protein